ncbi:MAG: flotillin family protein, partial [Methylobacteriaceae bacterium]|nr:flotillin family protein [Methylobacteriaceae bacterium]
MTTQILGDVILWLIALAIVVVIAVYLLRWLYRRSTKDTAFVRTGFLGEKVVINGGALVIPVLHEVTPVNMNVTRIEVRRGERTALSTKNRMRIDLVAEFFVRVQPSSESVAFAAQTLGARALQPDGIRDLLEGKFASALRAIAAEMTLEEIHERRQEFMTRVKSTAAEALALNGLELESVALVELDQTSLEFFDPSNAFDAEGLTQLTEAIELRRKMRNQIEQQTMIAIRDQNLDAERRVLEIERESEYARLEQEREIEVRRAGQRAELARERAQRDQEAQEAQISASESVERSRIVQERVLAENRIA